MGFKEGEEPLPLGCAGVVEGAAAVPLAVPEEARGGGVKAAGSTSFAAATEAAVSAATLERAARRGGPAAPAPAPAPVPAVVGEDDRTVEAAAAAASSATASRAAAPRAGLMEGKCTVGGPRVATQGEMSRVRGAWMGVVIFDPPLAETSDTTYFFAINRAHFPAKYLRYTYLCVFIN